MLTGTASRLTWPLLSIAMTLVLGSDSGLAALALGSSTLMPCTAAVVMMMKITSSTYARSSIGVMLMSS